MFVFLFSKFVKSRLFFFPSLVFLNASESVNKMYRFIFFLNCDNHVNSLSSVMDSDVKIASDIKFVYQKNRVNSFLFDNEDSNNKILKYL